MLNPNKIDRRKLTKRKIAKRLSVLVLVFQLLASMTGTAKNIAEIFQTTGNDAPSLPAPHQEVGE